MIYNACFDKFKSQILTLSYWAWEGYPRWPDVENWLKNFDGSTGNTKEIEQLHALFILSQFLFYGSKQIRTLLQALYRDLFLIPLIQKIRDDNENTRNVNFIKSILKRELGLTRFLGIGNPSDSGVHLLYYFRQENNLPSSLFCSIADVITIKKGVNNNIITELSNKKIARYVFIDDICGTGDTAIKYSQNIFTNIKDMNKNVEFYYLTLFATASGLNEVKKTTVFKQNCSTIFELDSTYKMLSNNSRYFANCPGLISKEVISKIIRHYGLFLDKKNPCGYGDNQLILGFNHNVPNNTIPIIWYEDETVPWIPIFKRHGKLKE